LLAISVARQKKKEKKKKKGKQSCSHKGGGRRFEKMFVCRSLYVSGKY
jgi:hypothetical protein